MGEIHAHLILKFQLYYKHIISDNESIGKMGDDIRPFGRKVLFDATLSIQ